MVKKSNSTPSEAKPASVRNYNVTIGKREKGAAFSVNSLLTAKI